MSQMLCSQCAKKLAGGSPKEEAPNGKALFDDEPLPETLDADFVCPHWKPEYWEKRGYQRNWGDACINDWPKMEVLRKETDDKVEYLVLAPTVLKHPAIYFFDKRSAVSWGSY
jgi:hypothetical protein